MEQTQSGRAQAQPSTFGLKGAERLIAEAIAALPEPHVRQAVANHFAQFLLKQPGRAFNPQRFCRATGGRLTGPTRVSEESRRPI